MSEVARVPEWTTAVPDWEARIVEGRSLIPFDPLFPDEAEQALRVFKALRVKDLQYHPTFGECCDQWVFDFVAAVFGAYDAQTGKQLIRDFFLLISKKNTKALALDTLIPTPSGWATMGALQPGDEVFGVDGSPCRVVSTSEVFIDHKCYRLTFSNGESVIADAGHLWFTEALLDSFGNKGNCGDVTPRRNRVRTTEEIANTLLRPGDGARNHSVRVPRPIDCQEVRLPVAPYTLGAWLGDGHSASGAITCHRDDVEILDAIRADGWPVRYASNNGSAANTYSLSDGDKSHAARKASLAATLRNAGILGNKHIPDIYFRGSYAQRLALLQGLMDTDGTISKSGRVLSYTGINERLVRGVAELLATLGIKSSTTSRIAKCSGVPASVAWMVQFMAFRDELPVFRLTRKLERMRLFSDSKRKARSRTVQIVSAEEVASVPVKCIAVDSPDHQFLFGRSMLPTHNSTIAAGLMMTALIRNWRADEEHLILAPTIEVAQNSFRPAASMVRADEELSDLFHVQDHTRTITHRNTNAALKVVAADTDTVSGKKSGRILIDEFWAFGKRPAADAMLMEATGGQISREEGWVIKLSTQSDEAPAGVFKEALDYFRGIRDGRIQDKKSFGLLYEFPHSMVESKAYLEPKNFYVTNPNIGRSVSAEWLEDNLAKNLRKGEGPTRIFIAKHLNIETGISLKSDAWPGAIFWEPCGDRTLTLQELLNRSEVVVGGVDGGGLDDLLGLAVLGREIGTGKWLHWAHAWCHPIVLERRKSEASKFRDFEKAGHLTIVAKIGDDTEGVADIFEQCEATGLLERIGADPSAVGGIVDAITARNIDADRIVGISQGWKLHGAIKTLERKLAEGAFLHGASPLMAYSVANAKAEARGNAVLIVKQLSGAAKIDPLMATLNCTVLMGFNPESRRRSYNMYFI
jgi:phage terminase large subunit-like protein